MIIFIKTEYFCNPISDGNDKFLIKIFFSHKSNHLTAWSYPSSFFMSIVQTFSFQFNNNDISLKVKFTFLSKLSLIMYM